MYCNPLRQNGFTLVELITVLVILGVMAVIGSSKFFSSSSFNASQYHQEILSAARYAQKIAIASQQSVAININSTDFSLCYGTGSSPACSPNNSDVKHPATQGKIGTSNSAFYTKSVPSGVSLTNVPKTIYFDSAGEPNDSSGKITTQQVITIVGMGNVNIEPVTGYVHD